MVRYAYDQHQPSCSGSILLCHAFAAATSSGADLLVKSNRTRVPGTVYHSQSIASGSGLAGHPFIELVIALMMRAVSPATVTSGLGDVAHPAQHLQIASDVLPTT
jgi:hypothetical protein